MQFVNEKVTSKSMFQALVFKEYDGVDASLHKSFKE